MKKTILALSLIVLVIGCVATPQPSIKSTIESPELKLRIEGVEKVQAEVSDHTERHLALEEKRFELDREKWEIEKEEKKHDELKSKLSSFCNFEGEYPTFDLYSVISLLDWKNIQADFETLYINGYRTIVVRAFSGGGSAFAGMGIADSIEQWKSRGVTVIGKAYGLIASATVPIFASTSERVASPSTLFMVHEAAMFKFFTTETHSDINSQKVMLDKMQEKYCEILAKNSNKSMEFWKSLEKDTTWFDAKQALEWGLVDRIE